MEKILEILVTCLKIRPRSLYILNCHGSELWKENFFNWNFLIFVEVGEEVNNHRGRRIPGYRLFTGLRNRLLNNFAPLLKIRFLFSSSIFEPIFLIMCECEWFKAKFKLRFVFCSVSMFIDPKLNCCLSSCNFSNNK